MASIAMNVREKFVLSNDLTVLACSGYEKGQDIIGRKLQLVSDDNIIKQIVILTSERSLLNKKLNKDIYAFETRDDILLTEEEIKTGSWFLIGE